MKIRRFAAALLLVLASFLPAHAVINYPATLDDNTTLFNIQNGDVYVAPFHNNPKDAVLALEAKVGVDGSSVVTSLDYLVKNAASVNPGHTHTGTTVTFENGTAGAPGLRFGNPVTDTTSGFFHPGTGIVAWSASGSEVFRASATGIGIFTSPFFALDVAGTVRVQSGNDLCFGGTGASDNDTCIDRSAAHVLRTAGTHLLVDQATGDDSLVVHGIAAKTGRFIRLFFLPADANPFWQVSPAGVLELGAGGASAVDTNLFRSAANTLKTDDSLIVAGTLEVQGATVTVAEGTNVVVGTATGTKIGTATSQKLGFFNATPVVQPLASAGLISSLQALGFIASGTFSGDITTTGTTTTGGFVGTVQSVTLANGANANVSVNATTTVVRLVGPTGAFSISGITNGASGRILYIYSTVNQTMTITDQATSTAANQIITQGAADIVCTATEPASFTLVYDGTSSRWRVLSTANCPIP